jgi:hypothetical protein
MPVIAILYELRKSAMPISPTSHAHINFQQHHSQTMMTKEDASRLFDESKNGPIDRVAEKLNSTSTEEKEAVLNIFIDCVNDQRNHQRKAIFLIQLVYGMDKALKDSIIDISLRVGALETLERMDFGEYGEDVKSCIQDFKSDLAVPFKVTIKDKQKYEKLAQIFKDLRQVFPHPDLKNQVFPQRNDAIKPIPSSKQTIEGLVKYYSEKHGLEIVQHAGDRVEDILSAIEAQQGKMNEDSPPVILIDHRGNQGIGHRLVYLITSEKLVLPIAFPFESKDWQRIEAIKNRFNENFIFGINNEFSYMVDSDRKGFTLSEAKTPGAFTSASFASGSMFQSDASGCITLQLKACVKLAKRKIAGDTRQDASPTRLLDQFLKRRREATLFDSRFRASQGEFPPEIARRRQGSLFPLLSDQSTANLNRNDPLWAQAQQRNLAHEYIKVEDGHAGKRNWYLAKTAMIDNIAGHLMSETEDPIQARSRARELVKILNDDAVAAQSFFDIALQKGHLEIAERWSQDPLLQGNRAENERQLNEAKPRRL